jgi:hypothetical protein
MNLQDFHCLQRAKVAADYENGMQRASSLRYSTLEEEANGL